MCRKLVFAAVAFCLLGLAGGAFAQCTVYPGETVIVTGSETCGTMYIAGTLIVESTGSVTGGHWSTLDGPGAQITINGGSFLIDGRFNVGQGSDGYITLNGGTFTVTGDFKFPDSDGGVHRIYLNDGIMHSRNMELYYDRNAIIYVADGILRLDEVSPGSEEYDPAEWLAQGALRPAAGYEAIEIEYVVAGGYTEVRAVNPDPNLASNPEPPDKGAVFDWQATLSWSPGVSAAKHDVYFGTIFDDVNDANDPNVSPGRGRQDSNTYDVSGLGLYKTYYWRVDEVNGLTVWKGEVWSFSRVETFTNSLGMVFIGIPPGTFTMGAGDSFRIQDEGMLDYDEQPAHEVTISKPLFMLQTRVADAYYQQSGLPGSASDVSWDNAAAFCQWLSILEGRTYRLPTEAEWEYVFENPRGVEGMDQREWVRDWHGLYGHDPLTDPVGPVNGVLKVIRGGTERDRWALPTNATYEPWYLGEAQACGFRVVLEQEPAETPHVSIGPYCQAAVKQSTAPALQGPDPDIPYFTVRFSMPVPPDNMEEYGMRVSGLASMLGCCPSTLHHNHSPGFEIMPNGDAVAVWFSAYEDEYGDDTRFVQARLRYGSDQWDLPELFWDMKGMNDESGLLWTEGDGTVHFFGGGRIDDSDRRPLVMAVSTDSGATWNLERPYFPIPAVNFTAQPCQNAWRQDSSTIYAVTDGDNPSASSIVWRSTDNGLTWYDMGGRTNGRHSTIVPIGDSGELLSYGGKNSDIDGYMPWNRSYNWGASWLEAGPTDFSPLGSNQRPCLIRLANGKLAFCADAQHKNNYKPPDTPYDYGCLVAISSNDGDSWSIRNLPVTLPHEWDRDYGTLGYSTIRQAPSGVIHILTTMTHPCLHYEFNERWIYSGEGDIPPETEGGTVNQYSEYYAGGALKATWSARTCTNGRYLLDGAETSYYEDGTKEHEVTYHKGRKTGTETFWAPDGTKIWSWGHDDVNNTSMWRHYWSNGLKRIESRWNSYPTARDLPSRNFSGFLAHGHTYHWDRLGAPVAGWNFYDGWPAGTAPLPERQFTSASDPSPADGAISVRRDPTLRWSGRDYAAQHDVYFGTDLNAVSNASATETLGVYRGRLAREQTAYEPPGLLEFGRTYYWRIDEVNDTYEESPVKGPVWSFKTVEAEYIVFDDMESYNSSDRPIYFTWFDYVNTQSGSFLNLGTAPGSPVHGGTQSMEYLYSNDFNLWGTGYYSVIERRLDDPYDWTAAGVEALNLYFYGDAGNDANETEQMYVGLRDSFGAYAEVRYGDNGEDMNDVKKQQWQVWNIALSGFGGVDLTKVDKVYIGFGDENNSSEPGGVGVVYFDDIRLYVPRCIPAYGPAGDLSGDCVVDLVDLGVLAGEWLETAGVVSDIYPDDKVDFKDYALLVNRWLGAELWPPE
ncbi:MAG: SUMF1/EgtB/PvdO family nonheme iron enzyme [Planctomycetota bacterium]|jgi:hypothetical protein